MFLTCGYSCLVFCSKAVVHMPKLSISGSYSLKGTLGGMGMANVFSPTADFSGITSDTLAISEVGKTNLQET